MNVLHPFANYVPTQENDINGVIHQIPKIKVNCESTLTPDEYSCINAITPLIDSHMRTWTNDENNWLNVNFSSNYMIVTHYSIQLNIRATVDWHHQGIGRYMHQMVFQIIL